VSREPEARKELLSLGLTSLPVLVIGAKTFSGFNPQQIDAALVELSDGR